MRVALVAFHLLKSLIEPIQPAVPGQKKANRRHVGALLCRQPPRDFDGSEAPEAALGDETTLQRNETEEHQEDIHDQTGQEHIHDEDSINWFSDRDAQQLLAEELPLVEAGHGVVSLDGIPSRLSSLLLAYVERASLLCATYDSDRDTEVDTSRSAENHNIKGEEDAGHIANVIAAAEEARMHNWTLAGCDTLLKLLVATTVQVAKRTELFSADAHASFL